MQITKLPLLLLLPLTTLIAHESIHSSATLYYENIDFSNSLQKTNGDLIGVGGDIHSDNSEYKFAFEHANTDTKQPPLKEDLTTSKIFLKYGYSYDNGLQLRLNYINILEDNIAPTVHGAVYGAGLEYTMEKISLGFVQYYTDYKEFDVYQSDLKVEYKTKISDIGIKLTGITKYIKLNDYQSNSFSNNAQEEYFTTALKIHTHYQSYHFGAALYLGERAFAIMNDGFKIQHHAMEFDQTYALGVGKSFANMVLRLQYIHQEATELPLNNQGVEVDNLRLIVNYKF